MATGFYLFLILFYMEKRLWPYLVTMFLLLFCREDVPFTLAALGLVMLAQRRWRYAAITIASSILWWIAVTDYIMPMLNGAGYFRHESGTVQVVVSNLFNVDYYIKQFITDHDAFEYLLHVFLPVSFLSLLAPVYLLPALPTLYVNTMIGGYNTDIGFHYSANVVPFVYLAAMVGVTRLASWAGVLTKISASWRMALPLLVLAILTGHSALSYSRLNLHPNRIVSDFRVWQQTAEIRAEIRHLKRTLISENNGVAASDYILPHFSHRKHAYLLPNPWRLHYWGIYGENQHHPNQVTFIVLMENEYRAYQDILTYLEDLGYFERPPVASKLVVLRRAKDEAEDRDEAIRQLVIAPHKSGLGFSHVMISPDYDPANMFPTEMDVGAARSSTGENEGWTLIEGGEEQVLDIDFLRWIPNGDYKAVLVYAEVDAEGGAATLLALDKPGILRPANLGDEVMPLELVPGSNFFYFRVVNATGAWRLMTRLIF